MRSRLSLVRALTVTARPSSLVASDSLSSTALLDTSRGASAAHAATNALAHNQVIALMGPSSLQNCRAERQARCHFAHAARAPSSEARSRAWRPDAAIHAPGT